MAQTGGPSFLANIAQRRRSLNRVREALLDRPGIQPPNPTAPPARAPAQNRTSPQQQAMAAQVQAQTAAATPREPLDEQPVPPVGSSLPPEIREEMLAQITGFLDEQIKQRTSALHRKIGRARRFFGGGV